MTSAHQTLFIDAASNSLDIENQCHGLYYPDRRLRKPQPRMIGYQKKSTKNRKNFPSLNVSDLEAWVEEDDDQDDDVVEDVECQQFEIPSVPVKVVVEKTEQVDGKIPDEDFVVVDDWSELESEDDDDDDDETSSQWTFASEAQQQQSFLAALLSGNDQVLVPTSDEKTLGSITIEKATGAERRARRTPKKEGGDFDFEGEYLATKADGEKGRVKGSGRTGGNKSRQHKKTRSRFKA